MTTLPRPVLFIGDSIIDRHNRPCNCLDEACECANIPEYHYSFIEKLQEQGVLAVDGGRGGFTTEIFVKLFESLVPAADPEQNEVQSRIGSRPRLPAAAVAICLGSNDYTVMCDDLPTQGVPPSRYRQNLLTLIDRVKAFQPDADIFLITPGAFNTELLYKDQLKRRPDISEIPINRSPKQAAHYAEICKEVAVFRKLPVIDMFAELEKFENPASYTYDGLHYSHQAYERYTAAILELLKTEFGGRHVVPTLDPSDVSYVYKEYRQFFKRGAEGQPDFIELSQKYNQGFELLPEDKEYYRLNPVVMFGPKDLSN